MKQIIIAVLAVVAIVGGAVILGKEEEAAGQVSNYIYGNAEATVKIVEFGDFECPACAFFYPIVKEVKEKYKDQISFQFRHFPLLQSHRNALAAHRAAEAAGKQGKFYEMHDLLYENQENWNGPSSRDSVGIPTEDAIKIFEGYAQQLSLDMDKYRADVQDSTTSGTINADVAEGKSQYQVSGTPTFIINGKKVEDTSTIDTVEEFSKIIDEALGNNTQSTTPSQAPDATRPEGTTEQ